MVILAATVVVVVAVGLGIVEPLAHLEEKVALV
jgi:hypothetical protein